MIRTGRLVRESKIGTQSWPPIFSSYSVGILEKLGYKCKLYDASVLKTSQEDTLKIIRDYHPDVISYYWSYDTRAEDLSYAERLAKEYRVILVGPWSAHYPEALKDCPSVEAMTFGQFEYTLPKLIEGQKAEGVTYKDGTHIPQRDPYNTQELDWMPFVTDVYKRHLEIKAYHQTSLKHPFTDLFSGEPGSCPFSCKFCSWTNGMFQLHPRRWQTRSLSNVMDELWWIKYNLPEVRQVFFQDSTLPTPWGLKISDQIISEKLKLCWGCYSRADKTLDEILKYRESGCRTFHVGYEFNDDTILSEINKGITVDQMTQFAHDMNKAKMWQSMSLMIFPYNTPDQIKRMIDWAKKMNPTRINVAQLQAYPNTPIMDVIAAHKDIPGIHMMDFDEMCKWEQWCFREFYAKNPSFWWNVISNPREWKNVLHDAIGMLKFFGESNNAEI